MDSVVETLKKRPWLERNYYCNYLAQSSFYTFYSIRMLAMAIANTSTDQKEYFRRSLEHFKEENGHDSIAIMDLKSLGEDIKNYSEKGMTRALWEPQFYKLQKNNTALLGYILALEYLPVKCFGWLDKTLSEKYGRLCSKFVHVHAEEDPDHVEKCLEQINQLSEFEKIEIFKNYEQTCSSFKYFLLDLEIN